MKKVDLSSLNLEEYFTSINIENIKNKLSIPKYKKITDRLELLIKADLPTIKKYLNIANYYSLEEKKEIEKAFNYSAHRQKEKFMKHFKKLNLKSCPFCNNNYIYFYTKGDGKANTLATLEHYYPKAKYPHLSLSFYNLIPSCSICNSKFKGNKEQEGKIVHPYYDDFNENAKFSINVNSLDVNKDIELEVNLNSIDEKCKTSIERFQLEKIYKQHNDIAKEIWNKAQAYNEDRINELYESFYKNLGYSQEDVKNFVFCSYLDKKDIHRKNHTKLTQDILKQFGLITRS
ncbi:hypothetical protein [Sulfurimonas sp.]|uniref:hypothetical protein n=1 Tax=Sulfurimonas sp. TaxID=2022749 RepID=UPI00260F9E28|nr:hypothetical protein [Sulfurimonas sp.]